MLSNYNFLTKADCIEIINKTSNLQENEFIGYSIENITNHVLGFLAEYFQLKITTKNKTGDHVTNHYFIKSMPLTNENKIDKIKTMGFFKKETKIYSKIFDNMKGDQGESKWRPYVYLVKDDLIVLEDLRHNEYKHVPDRTEFSTDHVIVSLKAIAQMHASSFDYEINQIKMRIDKKYKEILFETLSPNNDWLMAGLRATKIIALNHPDYGVKYKNEIENNFMNILLKIFDLVNPSEKYRNVLAHRDLWISNLLFKYSKNDLNKPERCLIIDYQNCRYNPPALDVMMFLYLNIRRTTRDINSKKFLIFYYKELEKELKKFQIDIKGILTEEDFINSCDLYKIIAMILNIVYYPLTQLPTGYLNKLQIENPEKYNSIVDKDRNDFILNQMKIDPFYKEYLNESVGELIEKYIL